MNKNLERITQAIEVFDEYDSFLDHAELEINLPSGFLRYASTDQVPDMHWDSLDVRMRYDHKEIRFSVNLCEASTVTSFTIKRARVPRTRNLFKYTVTEEIWLSLPDAKELFRYLQDYFRCFTLKINTKLLR